MDHRESIIGAGMGEEATEVTGSHPITRRRFLGMSGAVGLSLTTVGAGAAAPETAQPAGTPIGGETASPSPTATQLHTVLGVVSSDDIENVLAHEHLFVDFLGPTDPNYMQPVNGFDAAIEVIVPYVEEVKAQGVNLIVDWGPVGVGRSLETVRWVSEQTGVHVIVPTGIYKNLRPAEFVDASVEELTEWMVGELTEGIEGTGVTAGFVKIAASPTPARGELEIHRAAARAAAATGVSLCCHLPFPLDAREQGESARARQVIDTALEEGLSLDRFVWGHASGILKHDGANLDSSVAQYVEAASHGATTQFDAVGADPAGGPEPFFHGPTDPMLFLDLIAQLVDLGYGDRVMISNDASVYVHPGGGPAGEHAQDYRDRGLDVFQYPRDIGYLYRSFAPALVERVGQAAARQVLRDTPLRVFGRP